jgi:hypothetical protein
MLARRSCIWVLGTIFNCALSLGQNILSLSSGSAAPCSSVTLDISFNATNPGSSAGLQWTLNAPSPEVVSFKTTVGPAALAAHRSLYCANQTCLLGGLPQVHRPWQPGAKSIPFSNGVVASVTLTLSPTATGNLAIQFSNPVEALLDGTAGSITTADGIVNVTPNSVRAPPAGMTLCPTAVSVGADETQQFTANFTDGSNTAITWSLDPAIGTIKDGVFTAPVLIPKPEPSSVTVTATSVADPTKSATAVITLVPFQFKKGQ